MVPFYVRYMGNEAYGLVGFFSMLQGWFQLLDMGLTPTMARETARFNGGAIDGLSLRRLLRALEGIFFAIAILGATTIAIGAGVISTNWLKVQQLPLSEVQYSVMLMAAIVGFRWVSGLYRGAINGFENLVWLGGFNMIIATARFVVVVPLFIFVGSRPILFFAYQLVLAVIELLTLLFKTYRLLPEKPAGKATPWEWKPLAQVLKFSLSVAFTSSVWVMVTQTDKLVLSKLLPLSDYAYFTLAVLVASGVLVISGPISLALLPRMTRLSSHGDDAALIQLYRNATQLIGVIAVPAALILACFSEQVLWAWTGNASIASKAAPILSLYALGNGILALGAFPYYLQFAKGDLKLHLLGNGLFVVLLIPTLIWSTLRFGAVGAGYAWVGANAAYFLCWIPLVHKRFVKGLHSKWLIQDVGKTVLLTVAGVAFLNEIIRWPHERILVGTLVGALGLAQLILSASGSSWVRKKTFSMYKTLVLKI